MSRVKKHPTPPTSGATPDVPKSPHGDDVRGINTRARIIAVAERLFAESGLKGVSMRDITKEANVNLASVNYHFGSKMELFRQVVLARTTSINAQRLELLAAETRDGPGTVEGIIGAIFLPAMRLCCDRSNGGHHHIRLISRLFSENPELARPLLQQIMQETMRRFGAALRAHCPDLDDTAFNWRMHCLIGSMVHVWHMMASDEQWALFPVDNPDTPENITRHFIGTMRPIFETHAPA